MLKNEIAIWTDVDVVQFRLAVNLGLMDDDPNFGYASHIFLSDNPIGNALYDILEKLVELRILERREDRDIQYRWNPAFRGNWK